MPFFPHTPESLIHRSDSKNPATTCKGLTSSGRPCRRSLAASPRSSPSPSKGRNGVLAVISDVDDSHDGAAAFFCWQHLEQAEILAQQAANGTTEVVELKERTSIDTLIDRLGVLDVQERDDGKRKRKDGKGGKPLRRETLPKPWHDVPGPLIAVPEDLMAANQQSKRPSRPPRQRHRKPKGEPTVNFSFFCCGSTPDVETLLTLRIRTSRPAASSPEMAQTHPSSNVTPSGRARLPAQLSNPQTPTRPPLRPQIFPTPTTPTLLSLIPPTLPPHTTSLLLAELAKPLPPSSDAGYVYIFWLTPDSSPAPSQADASSLLNRSSSTRRQPKDVLKNLGQTSSTNTILLKIGRASNVQRRLNEWTRQCNHNLSLIRYYPYHPSSSPQPSSQAPSPLPSPSTRPPSKRTLSTPTKTSQAPDAGEPRKVPHAHRVERLIHLELADKRVKRLCAGCGKEHREWFEVSADREGVRGVDGVVRRWVGWAEGLRM
ncbi:hypothetical protein MMC30_005342 [Trapelia coarctata]|nr:hypothetical protein [Trapelia coarctata]